MKSLFYLSLVAAGMFAVHANGQSLYTLAGPVGLEESLPLKWFFNLAGGYDDNVNASNYNKQESAFISTDIGCSLANYDAVTQYSFSAKLGGIFYLKDLDGGTNEALSNSTLSAKLSHSFDQTLRYNGSVSFAWQPEPNYSNGIANARRLHLRVCFQFREQGVDFPLFHDAGRQFLHDRLSGGFRQDG